MERARFVGESGLDGGGASTFMELSIVRVCG